MFLNKIRKELLQKENRSNNMNINDEKILNSENLKMTKTIGYILLFTTDEEFKFTALEKWIEFFSQEDFDIEKIDSNFLKIVTGSIIVKTKDEIEIIINDLITKIKNSGISFKSCIFGIEDTLCGIVGTEKRKNFVSFIPNYNQLILQGIQLENGSIKQISYSKNVSG